MTGRTSSLPRIMSTDLRTRDFGGNATYTTASNEGATPFRGGGVSRAAPPRNRRSQTATRPPSMGMIAPFT